MRIFSAGFRPLVINDAIIILHQKRTWDIAENVALVLIDM
jgi:hypothetical protein